MILMLLNLWKAAPTGLPAVFFGSRSAPSAIAGAKKEIQLRRERCFLLTETFDV